MELISRLTHASIDICTKCQLKCISCSTSKGIIRNGFVKEGWMTLDLFIHIIELNPYIRHIELSNLGEIFLNPDIIGIMQYAFRRGISLYCSNGTNFNYVPIEVLEGLVKYQFKCLNISIDGVTQSVYSQYRKNGNIENVLSNIRMLNHFKQLYNCSFPKLSWQFIIFGHNEHEILEARTLCNELNMVFNPRLNHSSFSPIRDAKMVKENAGIKYATRVEYKRQSGSEYKQPCYQCLFSPQVNWNGDVLGCCVNKWRGLGNATHNSLSDIMNSHIYKLMIDFLFGKCSVSKDIPCFYCPNASKVKEHPLSSEGLNIYSKYVPIALRYIQVSDMW